MFTPDIYSIAIVNPELAWLLVEGRRRWTPRIENLIWTLTDDEPDQPLQQKMDKSFDTDCWIVDGVYTLRMPLAHAGSSFKGDSDYFTNLTPYLDVSLEFEGVGPQCDFAMVSPGEPVPIEHAFRNATGPGCAPSFANYNILCRKRQYIQMNLWPRRHLTESELGMQVIISFLTYRVDECCAGIAQRPSDLTDWQQSFIRGARSSSVK